MSSRIIGHYLQSFSRCGNVNNAFRSSSTVPVASLPSCPVTFRAYSRAASDADRVDVGPALLLSSSSPLVLLAAVARGRKERWSGIVVPVSGSSSTHCIVNQTRSGETVQEVKPPLYNRGNTELGSDECEGARTERWRFSDDAT